MEIYRTKKELLEYGDSMINKIRELLTILDQNLRVATASCSFYDFFKVKPK